MKGPRETVSVSSTRQNLWTYGQQHDDDYYDHQACSATSGFALIAAVVSSSDAREVSTTYSTRYSLRRTISTEKAAPERTNLATRPAARPTFPNLGKFVNANFNFPNILLALVNEVFKFVRIDRFARSPSGTVTVTPFRGASFKFCQPIQL